jgi:uncharacterized repeat protein (TIGR03803 family)
VRCFCVVRNNNYGSACPDFQHAAQLRWPGRRIATFRAGPGFPLEFVWDNGEWRPSSRGGTIFKIVPNGALTTVYSFCSQSGCADGAYPYAGLAQATSGELYGTTTGGGTNQLGTLFRIALNGGLTTLHSFCSLSGCTAGKSPTAGRVQAVDGNFYGTTETGGANWLLSQRRLVQAIDGNLYGTTTFAEPALSPPAVAPSSRSPRVAR